ncbi:TonB-dependent siderophore receptor [Herminiimonas sp. KBW02]|uniref:TonB-dependent receptor n=1 Tax=Herminiimonas sp. KBW02 TaxID=2153363 RepID=UPI0018F7C13F|nr:TonB-dependent siderophore receptor [Herminiimonas sp. KBW02]
MPPTHLHLQIKRIALAVAMACTHTAVTAQTTTSPSTEKEAEEKNKIPHQVLPHVYVSPDVLDHDDARVKTVSTATKTAMNIKDIPQTIDTLEMSKSKVYGQNDLSVLLDGTPGIDTSYDTRGDGLTIRGFEASSGDIYRDGARASGQIRRSTANVERIEILKGPASVLYGRGQGGGVVNLVSKQANFDSPSSVGLRGGSWKNRGTTIDLNRIITPNLAARLTIDYEEADSFRRGIANQNKMISPSILYDNKRGFTWLAQYTYDKVWRRPDRGPSYNNLPPGVDFRTAYAHPQDYMEDRMQMFRSVLTYDFGNDWSLKWTSALHEASQNFDNLYAGTYNAGTRQLTFTRVWQEADNTSLTNSFDLAGKFRTGGIKHDVLAGLEFTKENRNPSFTTAGASSSNPSRYPYGVDPYNPVWTHSKTPTGPYTTANRHKADASALYLQDLIEITPQWKVLAGLRFDRFTFNSLNLIKNEQRGYSGNTVSPRVGLIWQPVEAHSIYLSYSKNFAPYGGRGMISVATGSSAIYDSEPQYSRQIETGVKSDWLNGNLSSQLAIYSMEKYNIRYQPDAVNDPYTWATGRQERSRGIEASLTGKLAQTWYIRSGIGLQEAEITKNLANPALVGNQKSGIARKNGNAFLRYVPTANWYGETGVTYRGPTYANDDNKARRSGYTRWDASVGYRALPWTVTLAVTNLTDKRYWRSTSMPGAPRNFLLSVNRLF